MEIYLKALKKGDEYAFRILFNKFYAPLCLFAERYLKDKDAAADIVQDTFIKYWNKHTDFDDYNKTKSFLYVSAYHARLNFLRDYRTNIDVDECQQLQSEDFFEKTLLEEEAYRLLYQAIDKLPPRMKSVMQCALEGLKNSEIAERLGMSEYAVHAHKKEAYKRIREEMKDYYSLLLVDIILFQYLN